VQGLSIETYPNVVLIAVVKVASRGFVGSVVRRDTLWMFVEPRVRNGSGRGNE
jgi:hypothetical protein